MKQAKFSLSDSQLSFLNRHRELGFKDRSALVRSALESFRAQADKKRLEESATLYARLYEEDSDLQALTAACIEDWPQ